LQISTEDKIKQQSGNAKGLLKMQGASRSPEATCDP